MPIAKGYAPLVILCNAQVGLAAMLKLLDAFLEEEEEDGTMIPNLKDGMMMAG